MAINDVTLNVGANLGPAQRQLQAFIAQANRQMGSQSFRFNLDDKGFNQPLGRITGNLNQFQGAMDASIARTLAFGASVGVIGGVTRAFKELVATTVNVEHSIKEINVLLNLSTKQLAGFSKELFSVAKNTASSFNTAAEAATEFSRQGLGAAETARRVNDALILARLSGLEAAASVSALTAAVNGFKKEGISTAEVVNRLANVDAAFAVSSADLAAALSRAGSVSQDAKVKFNELLAATTAVQQATARGGNVIGNGFKTIFTRLQRSKVRQELEKIGVATTDSTGKIRGAISVLQDYAKVYETLSDQQRAYTSEQVAGVFQINTLKALLGDLSSDTSVYTAALKTANQTTDEAVKRNDELNKTLKSLTSQTGTELTELAAKFGKLGLESNFKGILGVLKGALGEMNKVVDSEGMGGDVARGFIRGFGNFLTGPGLAIALVGIVKLLQFIGRETAVALKQVLAIGSQSQRRQVVQERVNQLLREDNALLKQILASEGNMVTINNAVAASIARQNAALAGQKALVQQISAGLALNKAGLLTPVGARGGGRGPFGRGAEGFVPNMVNRERSSISRGVGGARAGDRPVVIPNFSFGGGKKGTMVAHTGEHIVPNYARGGSAIFNRNMASSMGLPKGAVRVGAQGFVPNFAGFTDMRKYVVPQGQSLTFRAARGPDGQTAASSHTTYTGGQSVWMTERQIRHYEGKPGNSGFMAGNVQGQAGGTTPTQEYMWNLDRQGGKGAFMGTSQKRFKRRFEHSFKSADRLVGTKPVRSVLGTAYGISVKGKATGKEKTAVNSLANVGQHMDEGIVAGVNTIFTKLRGQGLKTLPENIDKGGLQKFMREGGPGALSAFRGAIFEGIVDTLTRGVTREGNRGTAGTKLDIELTGSNRKFLEPLFGLSKGQYVAGDLKGLYSDHNKRRFVIQAIQNQSALGTKLTPIKKGSAQTVARSITAKSNRVYGGVKGKSKGRGFETVPAKPFKEGADGYVPSFANLAGMSATPAGKRALSTERSLAGSARMGYDSRVGYGVFNNSQGSLSNAMSQHVNSGDSISSLGSMGAGAQAAAEGFVPRFALQLPAVRMPRVGVPNQGQINTAKEVRLLRLQEEANAAAAKLQRRESMKQMGGFMGMMALSSGAGYMQSQADKAMTYEEFQQANKTAAALQGASTGSVGLFAGKRVGALTTIIGALIGYFVGGKKFGGAQSEADFKYGKTMAEIGPQQNLIIEYEKLLNRTRSPRDMEPGELAAVQQRLGEVGGKIPEIVRKAIRETPEGSSERRQAVQMAYREAGRNIRIAEIAKAIPGFQATIDTPQIIEWKKDLKVMQREYDAGEYIHDEGAEEGSRRKMSEGQDLMDRYGDKIKATQKAINDREIERIDDLHIYGKTDLHKQGVSIANNVDLTDKSSKELTKMADALEAATDAADIFAAMERTPIFKKFEGMAGRSAATDLATALAAKNELRERLKYQQKYGEEPDVRKERVDKQVAMRIGFGGASRRFSLMAAREDTRNKFRRDVDQAGINYIGNLPTQLMDREEKTTRIRDIETKALEQNRLVSEQSARAAFAAQIRKGSLTELAKGPKERDTGLITELDTVQQGLMAGNSLEKIRDDLGPLSRMADDLQDQIYAMEDLKRSNTNLVALSKIARQNEDQMIKAIRMGNLIKKLDESRGTQSDIARQAELTQMALKTIAEPRGATGREIGSERDDLLVGAKIAAYRHMLTLPSDPETRKDDRMKLEALQREQSVKSDLKGFARQLYQPENKDKIGAVAFINSILPKITDAQVGAEGAEAEGLQRYFNQLKFLQEALNPNYLPTQGEDEQPFSPLRFEDSAAIERTLVVDRREKKRIDEVLATGTAEQISNVLEEKLGDRFKPSWNEEERRGRLAAYSDEAGERITQFSESRDPMIPLIKKLSGSIDELAKNILSLKKAPKEPPPKVKTPPVPALTVTVSGHRGKDVPVPQPGSARGYLPRAASGSIASQPAQEAFARERSAIASGVGGARPGIDQPTLIPNFNGGPVVAHTGEYLVNNYGGGQQSAIFNRSMISSMGMPSGAMPIGAAGGSIPGMAGGGALGPPAPTFTKEQVDAVMREMRRLILERFEGAKGVKVKVGPSPYGKSIGPVAKILAGLGVGGRVLGVGGRVLGGVGLRVAPVVGTAMALNAMLGPIYNWKARRHNQSIEEGEAKGLKQVSGWGKQMMWEDQSVLEWINLLYLHNDEWNDVGAPVDRVPFKDRKRLAREEAARLHEEEFKKKSIAQREKHLKSIENLRRGGRETRARSDELIQSSREGIARVESKRAQYAKEDEWRKMKNRVGDEGHAIRMRDAKAAREEKYPWLKWLPEDREGHNRDFEYLRNAIRTGRGGVDIRPDASMSLTRRAAIKEAAVDPLNPLLQVGQRDPLYKWSWDRSRSAEGGLTSRNPMNYHHTRSNLEAARVKWKEEVEDAAAMERRFQYTLNRFTRRGPAPLGDFDTRRGEAGRRVRGRAGGYIPNMAASARERYMAKEYTPHEMDDSPLEERLRREEWANTLNSWMEGGLLTEEQYKDYSKQIPTKDEVRIVTAESGAAKRARSGAFHSGKDKVIMLRGDVKMPKGIEGPGAARVDQLLATRGTFRNEFSHLLSRKIFGKTSTRNEEVIQKRKAWIIKAYNTKLNAKERAFFDIHHGDPNLGLSHPQSRYGVKTDSSGFNYGKTRHWAAEEMLSTITAMVGGGPGGRLAKYQANHPWEGKSTNWGGLSGATGTRGFTEADLIRWPGLREQLEESKPYLEQQKARKAEAAAKEAQREANRRRDPGLQGLGEKRSKLEEWRNELEFKKGPEGPIAQSKKGIEESKKKAVQRAAGETKRQEESKQRNLDLQNRLMGERVGRRVAHYRVFEEKRKAIRRGESVEGYAVKSDPAYNPYHPTTTPRFQMTSERLNMPEGYSERYKSGDLHLEDVQWRIDRAKREGKELDSNQMADLKERFRTRIPGQPIESSGGDYDFGNLKTQRDFSAAKERWAKEASDKPQYTKWMDARRNYILSSRGSPWGRDPETGKHLESEYAKNERRVREGMGTNQPGRQRLTGGLTSLKAIRDWYKKYPPGKLVPGSDLAREVAKATPGGQVKRVSGFNARPRGWKFAENRAFSGQSQFNRSEGYIPNLPTAAGGEIQGAFNRERSDIAHGVGGARPGMDQPRLIPNFNGGPVVAHTGEYLVNNYGGGGQGAIFNRSMISSMGMPRGARRIGAAGGYIPNMAGSSPNPYDRSAGKHGPVQDFDKLYPGQERPGWAQPDKYDMHALNDSPLEATLIKKAWHQVILTKLEMGLISQEQAFNLARNPPGRDQVAIVKNVKDIAPSVRAFYNQYDDVAVLDAGELSHPAIFMESLRNEFSHLMSDRMGTLHGIEGSEAEHVAFNKKRLAALVKSFDTLSPAKKKYYIRRHGDPRKGLLDPESSYFKRGNIREGDAAEEALSTMVSILPMGKRGALEMTALHEIRTRNSQWNVKPPSPESIEASELQKKLYGTGGARNFAGGYIPNMADGLNPGAKHAMADPEWAAKERAKLWKMRDDYIEKRRTKPGDHSAGATAASWNDYSEKDFVKRTRGEYINPEGGFTKTAPWWDSLRLFTDELKLSKSSAAERISVVDERRNKRQKEEIRIKKESYMAKMYAPHEMDDSAFEQRLRVEEWANTLNSWREGGLLTDEQYIKYSKEIPTKEEVRIVSMQSGAARSKAMKSGSAAFASGSDKVTAYFGDIKMPKGIEGPGAARADQRLSTRSTFRNEFSHLLSKKIFGTMSTKDQGVIDARHAWIIKAYNEKLNDRERKDFNKWHGDPNDGLVHPESSYGQMSSVGGGNYGKTRHHAAEEMLSTITDMTGGGPEGRIARYQKGHPWEGRTTPWGGAVGMKLSDFTATELKQDPGLGEQIRESAPFERQRYNYIEKQMQERYLNNPASLRQDWFDHFERKKEKVEADAWRQLLTQYGLGGGKTAQSLKGNKAAGYIPNMGGSSFIAQSPGADDLFAKIAQELAEDAARERLLEVARLEEEKRQRMRQNAANLGSQFRELRNRPKGWKFAENRAFSGQSQFGKGKGLSSQFGKGRGLPSQFGKGGGWKFHAGGYIPNMADGGQTVKPLWPSKTIQPWQGTYKGYKDRETWLQFMKDREAGLLTEGEPGYDPRGDVEIGKTYHTTRWDRAVAAEKKRKAEENAKTFLKYQLIWDRIDKRDKLMQKFGLPTRAERGLTEPSGFGDQVRGGRVRSTRRWLRPKRQEEAEKKWQFPFRAQAFAGGYIPNMAVGTQSDFYAAKERWALEEQQSKMIKPGGVVRPPKGVRYKGEDLDIMKIWKANAGSASPIPKTGVGLGTQSDFYAAKERWALEEQQSKMMDQRGADFIPPGGIVGPGPSEYHKQEELVRKSIGADGKVIPGSPLAIENLKATPGGQPKRDWRMDDPMQELGYDSPYRDKWRFGPEPFEGRSYPNLSSGSPMVSSMNASNKFLNFSQGAAPGGVEGAVMAAAEAGITRAKASQEKHNVNVNIEVYGNVSEGSIDGIKSNSSDMATILEGLVNG